MNIRPYSKNAKKHPDEQLRYIALSLREYGWRQPIVVDKDGEIIVGHGRWMAFNKYPDGIKEPWIEVASDLTPDQIKGYRLMDNKTNESEWDMELVVQELKDLDAVGFDLDLTGFDSDLLLESDDKDDYIPVDVPARSKVGDLWILGNHRLLCGDSTNPEHVSRLMDGKKADMVFTDPPYNVNYSGSGENTSNGIMNDKMSDEKFEAFLSDAFARYAAHSKEGAGWYVFHSYHAQDTFRKAIEKTAWKVKSQLIWNKPSAGLGMNEYRPKHEPFFYCVNTEAAFYGDRTGTTVWDFQKSEQQLFNWAKREKKAEQEGKMTIWTMKRENVAGYVHPTQKPVELITYALLNSSKAEDIVMDTFLGSGSTLIAAEKTNRHCYGMELDPKYADTICQRYADFSNNTPVREDGVRWNEI